MAKSQSNCILCGTLELGKPLGKLIVPRCCATCSLECEEYVLTRLRGLALAVLRPCGVKQCKLCKKEFIAHHGMQSYCNTQCQRRAQGARQRRSKHHTVKCDQCGTTFTTGCKSKITCSPICASQRSYKYNQAWRKQRRLEGKEANYKKR